MDQASFFEKDFLEGTIDLTFSGKATEGHTMDLQAYAKSLIGFNEAFVKLNKVLFHTDITVEIVAEEKGSLRAKMTFTGVILAGISIYANFAQIDDYHDYKISNAMNGAFVQVIDWFKASKGDEELLKQIVEKYNLSDEEKARLIRLLKNIDFRLSLDDMTHFLERNGFDNVKIDGGKKLKTQITKTDRPYFKVHPEDLKSIEEIDDVLTVVAIGNHQEWRFRGREISKPFNAKILDDDFLQKIKQHPAKEIFKMRFEACVVKTSIIKAGNRKPSPPTYEIDSLKVFNESLPLPLKTTK